MPATKRKTGEADQANEIIDSLSQGIPLAEICRRPGMPGLRTVYDWLERDAELSARFARARVAGYDMIAVEALRIADTPEIGETTEDKEWGVATKREDMLGHRKLQVETRLKLLAKWDPKRYGDRMQQDVAVTGLGDILAALDGKALKPVPNDGD